MHDNRAYSDPAGQAGKQSHLPYSAKARWPAADVCSAPANRRAGETKREIEGRGKKEAQQGEGRAEREGPCPSSPT